jgi:ABC-type multidrug transport system fused ATPase/permease subunit
MSAQLSMTNMFHSQNSLYVFAAVILCTTTSIYFVAALVPMFAIYLLTQSYYRKTSRELKRLDGTTRSPIYSGFQEMLAGLETIRAFGQVIMDAHIKGHIQHDLFYVVERSAAYLQQGARQQK